MRLSVHAHVLSVCRCGARSSVTDPPLMVSDCLEVLGSTCRRLPSVGFRHTLPHPAFYTSARDQNLRLFPGAITTAPPNVLLWPAESMVVFFLLLILGNVSSVSIASFLTLLIFSKNKFFVSFFSIFKFSLIFFPILDLLFSFALLLWVYSAFVFQDSWGSLDCWLETVHLFMHECSVINFPQ